jgi:hypothetical protein
MQNKKYSWLKTSFSLTLKQIKRILKNDLLREKIMENLSEKSVDLYNIDNIDFKELINLYDVVEDVFLNTSIEVKSFAAQFSEDVDIFSIGIYGIRGCYYVKAPEFDVKGVFDTIKEAENYIKFDFNDSLLKNQN